MTVGELRALLEGIPDDVRVVVDGYEGGQDDPVFVRCVVRFDVREPGYEGPHTAWKYDVLREASGRVERAVLLSAEAETAEYTTVPW